MNLLGRVAVALTAWSQRWIPSAFSIACLLTLVTFALGMTAGAATPARVLVEWGNGFWTLLPFAMQMSLVIMTGYIVSTAPLVDRLFHRIAQVPQTPRGAIVLMALMSMGLAWIHWGLSLVGCAMLVRHVARAQRGADYRLLVAVAYFGMGATWHSGLSASAPLLVATPGHFLEAEIGLIPVSRTIFHPFNLVLTVLVVGLLAALAGAMHPPPERTVSVDDAALDALHAFEPPRAPAADGGTGARLDHLPVLNLSMAACGGFWLIHHFASSGFVLTLDVLNFAFLMLGVALHRTPASLLAAADHGARLVAGVVLQFPFYAGMYGVIQGTRLASALGEWLADVASGRWFPLLLYWYSGIVNYFVPSGGSKWAIEAPYLIEAAGRLGVGYDQVVVAYAWGDMATDLIQPFWALPLLAAARLDFRDIMGYEMLVFVVYAAVASVAFGVMPLLW